MTWTNFPTSPQTYFYTGQLIAAADMNTYIRDNMNYLLSGRPIGFLKRSAQYTFTNTAWADVDATNLILNVSTASGRLWVAASIFCASANSGNAYTSFDAVIDSTTRLGDATYGLGTVGGVATIPLTICGSITGLSVGSHSVKLQNKCAAAPGGSITGTGS